VRPIFKTIFFGDFNFVNNKILTYVIRLLYNNSIPIIVSNTYKCRVGQAYPDAPGTAICRKQLDQSGSQTMHIKAGSLFFILITIHYHVHIYRASHQIVE